MAVILDNSFIRSVSKHTSECANPIQLRNYLFKYRKCIISVDVRDIFIERTNFFKDKFGEETIYLNAINEIIEAFEDEIRVIDLTACNSDDFGPKDRDLVTLAINETNGNKLYMCKMLNVSYDRLNLKIKRYKLKLYLNTVRRNYRNSLRRNMKD